METSQKAPGRNQYVLGVGRDLRRDRDHVALGSAAYDERDLRGERLL